MSLSLSSFCSQHSSCDCINLFVQKPALYFKGKSSLSTNFGVMMTILTVLSIFSISVYFSVITFQRTSVHVIFNQDSQVSPFNNFTKYPFTFNLLDSSGNILPNQDRIYTIAAQLWTFTTSKGPEGQKILKSSKVDIKLDKCNVNQSFGDYRDYFIQSPSITSKYCLSPNAVNLTLSGVLGGNYNEVSFVQVYINRCLNDTLKKRTNCYDIDYINNALSSVNLEIGYLDNDINHNNPASPVILNKKANSFPLSSTVFRRIYNYKRMVQYSTDYGYVFEDWKTETFFQDDSRDVQFDFRTEGPYPGSFSLLTILNSGKVDNYKRSYTKLQELLANIGGVVKGVMLIGHVISFIFTRKLLNIAIINCNYVKLREYLNSSKENQKISKREITTEKNSLPNLPNGTLSQLSIKRSTIDMSQQMKNKKIEKMRFRFTFAELVLPTSCFRSQKKLIEFEKYQQIINRMISIEYILNKLLIIDELKEVNENIQALLKPNNSSGNLCNNYIDDAQRFSAQPRMDKKILFNLDIK